MSAQREPQPSGVRVRAKNCCQINGLVLESGHTNQSYHSATQGGEDMKRIMILSTLAVLFVGGAVALADNPHMGTWKLNEAKSKFAPGASKNTTVIYETVGDSVKVTVDGVDGAGNPSHNEWTGKFDNKFYPVTGDPTSDQRSYRKINNHVLALTGKKDGKISLTGRIVVSANGRLRTVTTKAAGSKVSNRAVYDKQ
jgi:hypothetical protein